MKRKKQKPTNKDLVYNIALTKQDLLNLKQHIFVIDRMLEQYIDFKEDTESFKQYLQSRLEKHNEEEIKATDETSKSDNQQP